ncbi:MAG: tetratricopeptide repeat protein, partial [Oscillospiraceae bacterium]|nr:tetratricopeptide repeat protein [Oscillospiraceae bacterium]
RTSEAVLRFLRCVENDPETFSDSETVTGLRNTAADMLINVNQYDKAADVLNKTLEKDAGNSSAKQMLARCYMELGEHEKSRELAKEVSDANPQDVTALWTLCVCALKKGENAEAIDAASRLADAVTGGQTEGDSLLFNCVTELSLRDGSAGYTHNLYTNDPEDENVLLIGKNEFLNDYCAAIYYCKMKRDYSLALEHVDRALKGHEQLSRLWYLKGLIHYSLEQFEESEKALLKADALDPNDLSIMYALVNTYDGMGDYKKAYDYCGRVVAKYPNGADHDEDVFGAMPHAGTMLERLRRLAEESE